METVTLDAGSVTAVKDFLEVLVDLKLDTLRGVFEYSGSGNMRTHPNRDNCHITRQMGGRSFDLYLKRHRRFELKEVLKLLMSRAPFRTAGRREWENILRLQGLGIPTPAPVAFGQRRLLIFEIDSFLISEAIPGGVPMDNLLKAEFAGPLEKEKLREKRALLWDLGDLVRRFHQAGLTHLDLYLCHVLVRPTETGEKALHLIDLQRVARRWLFKKRWIVKDLAALLYSTAGLPLTRTDLARFFTAYFDGAVSPAGRALVAAAIKRADRMAAKRSQQARMTPLP